MIRKKKKSIDFAKIKKEVTKITKEKYKQIKKFAYTIRPEVWIILAILTFSILTVIFLFSGNTDTDIQKSDHATVIAVSQMVLLPSDVQPIILTVADEQKMKDKTFFNNAKNGDKILIYQTLKRAILFRPSISKIIDIAPINPKTLFKQKQIK